MTETVDVDKVIAETPQEEFDYPRVSDCPPDYPDIMNALGDSWYSRAIYYERMTGKKVPKRNTILDDDGNEFPPDVQVYVSVTEDGGKG